MEIMQGKSQTLKPEHEQGYAAFISYRHTERDYPIAAALHRQLEVFVFPSRAIKKEKGKKKFGRVFRDKDELPLTGDLSQALQESLAQSEWLICLICDDYFQSEYCVNELRFFVSLHGLGCVIPVITDGKAPDVFPMFWRALYGIAKPYDEKGIPIEPLAMEIGAESHAKRLKNLKNEKLRLFSRMLDVKFDSLYRRFHRRRVRLIAIVSATVVLIVSAFAASVVYSARQIEKMRVAAVKNEIQLLIQQSLGDSYNSNNLEATRNALKAYARCEELYPLGDPGTRGQIQQALSAAAYSQPYQLVQNIYNDNRYMWGLTYSPDDKYILAVTGSGTAIIDSSNGRILGSTAHAGGVDGVQFSPSGKYYLAVENWTNRVTVFKTADPKHTVSTYVFESEYANKLSGATFISDESVVISTWEATLVIWDFVNGTTSEISDEDIMRGTSNSTGAVISPDAGIAVCALDFLCDTLPVIDLNTGTRLNYPMPEDYGCRTYAFSPDGRLLAGAFPHMIIIWDTDTQEVRLTIKTENFMYIDVFSKLIFSPDGKMLAATSSENVTVYRIPSGKQLYELGQLDLDVGFYELGAAFSPDSNEIMVYGNIAQVFDLRNGKLISDFDGKWATCSTFSSDGRYIAMVTVEGDAGIYSTVGSATAHVEKKNSTKLYTHPQWFETSYQPPTLYQSHTYDESIYSYMRATMANDPSGRFMAATYPDGYVEVWDLDNTDGHSAYLINEHYGVISQTRITARYLITSGYDGRIMVFDVINGETTRFFSVGERIPRFEVSKDGDMIIVQTESGSRAPVYDIESGNCIYLLEAEAGDVIADIGFTNNGAAAVIVQESGRAISGSLFRDFETLLDHAIATMTIA